MNEKMGPYPTKGVLAVSRAVAGARDVLEAGPLLVAVSAGVDSTVLAHALCRERGLAGRVCLAHVNHHLRQAASEADEGFVRELAKKLGVPLQVSEVHPEKLRQTRSGRARPSPEEAARDARYAALRGIAARRGARLVLAHHADDQAETVLLRLFRGSGPDALGGMRPISRDGCILRPLLGVSRHDIEDCAENWGLSWREDASNRDESFARNRLRRRWLPELQRAFNPQLLRTLANFAEAQRTDREFFSQLVDDAYGRIVHSKEADDFVVSAEAFRELHEALARRVVVRLFAEAGIGRELTRRHLERASAFLRGGASGGVVEFPNGWRLRRDGSDFRFSRTPVLGSGGC